MEADQESTAFDKFEEKYKEMYENKKKRQLPWQHAKFGEAFLQLYRDTISSQQANSTTYQPCIILECGCMFRSTKSRKAKTSDHEHGTHMTITKFVGKNKLGTADHVVSFFGKIATQETSTHPVTIRNFVCQFKDIGNCTLELVAEAEALRAERLTMQPDKAPKTREEVKIFTNREEICREVSTAIDELNDDLKTYRTSAYEGKGWRKLFMVDKVSKYAVRSSMSYYMERYIKLSEDLESAEEGGNETETAEIQEKIANLLLKLERDSLYCGRDPDKKEKKMTKLVIRKRPAPAGQTYEPFKQWVNSKFPIYTSSPDLVLVDEKTRRPLSLIELKGCTAGNLYSTQNTMQYQLMLFMFEMESMFVAHSEEKMPTEVEIITIAAEEIYQEKFRKLIPLGVKRFHIPRLLFPNMGITLTREEAADLSL